MISSVIATALLCVFIVLFVCFGWKVIWDKWLHNIDILRELILKETKVKRRNEKRKSAFESCGKLRIPFFAGRTGMPFSSALASYEKFIIGNAETVGFIETLMQTGYNLTPSRFGGDAEVTGEGVYALINLISLYHDVIIWKHSQKELTSVPSTIPNKRILPHWWQKTSILLSSITATELFVEVYFRSKKKRWRAVVVVELLRSFIRLMLLYKARGSILVRQRVPIRDKSPKIPTEDENSFNPSPINHRETLMDWARSEASAKMGGSSWIQYWVKQSDAPRNLAYIPTFPQPKRTLGEILYIFRPIVYLFALLRFGRKSWLPWLLSLIVDYLSNKLAHSQSQINVDEAEELTRRKMLWVLYLVRSPFFEKVLCVILKKILPNFLHNKNTRIGGSVRNMVKGYRNIYFYTAGSD